MECVLCSKRDNETEVLYKDEHVFIALNIEPVKDGHVLILPLRHAENLSDLTPDEARAFLGAIDKCMRMVEKEFGEGPMCFVNGWKFRSQPHLHAHVLPSKGGLRHLYMAAEGTAHRVRKDLAELEPMHKKLRGHFET